MLVLRYHPITLLQYLWKAAMHRRYKTFDREATPVLTVEQIGPKRHRTPEGYLLCLDVPVARVGEMLYAQGEVPLNADGYGRIRVTRDDEALFDERALASLQGKPVVDEHPEDFVDAKTWRKLSKGITLNPRRGEGENRDCIVADLLVMDEEMIKDIDSNKREVSGGYEADYQQTGEGEGRQTNIIFNHVALVEKGRCGPRCAIGDHLPKELQGMPTSAARERVKIRERIRVLFRDAADEVAGVLEDPSAAGDLNEPESDGAMSENGHTHIHIHSSGDPGAPSAKTNDDPTEARFQALEQGHQQILQAIEELRSSMGGGKTTTDEVVQPGADSDMTDLGDGGDAAGQDDNPEITTKDGMPEELQAAKTNDSAALQNCFLAVLADAEVLIPGFKLPTFDAAASRKLTLDSMCKLRRRVLGNVAATTDGAALLDSVGANIDLDKSTCAEVARAFRAGAGAKKLINNRAATGDSGKIPNLGAQFKQPPRTPAEINKAAAEFWSTVN